jgi:hypothetical protein
VARPMFWYRPFSAESASGTFLSMRLGLPS